MLDRDAEDSTASTERGRKAAQFRDFYEGVKLDITDTARFGSTSTTILVSQSNLEFVDRLIEVLSEEGYTASFDGRRLSVSWPEP